MKIPKKLWWWMSGAITPAEESLILMEDSGNLLMEDSTNILTE